MCVFSSACVTRFIFLICWLWPDNLHIWTWPRHYEAVPAYQKWSFCLIILRQCFQKLEHEQDRHTQKEKEFICQLNKQHIHSQYHTDTIERITNRIQGWQNQTNKTAQVLTRQRTPVHLQSLHNSTATGVAAWTVLSIDLLSASWSNFEPISAQVNCHNRVYVTHGWTRFDCVTLFDSISRTKHATLLSSAAILLTEIRLRTYIIL